MEQRIHDFFQGNRPTNQFSCMTKGMPNEEKEVQNVFLILYESTISIKMQKAQILYK